MSFLFIQLWKVKIPKLIIIQIKIESTLIGAVEKNKEADENDDENDKRNKEQTHLTKIKQHM